METPPDDRPSGPYRSHLLSVLRRQFLRWQTQSQVAWRRARSASLWGLQVLLSPIYGLWQREATPQLAGAETLERVLATASSELATGVRAIACDRHSRQPVAIAPDGRLLPLPPSLQGRLQAWQPPRPRGLAGRRLWPRGSLSIWGESHALASQGKTAIVGAAGNLWSPSTPEDPFSLAALIQGAIAYFFGPRATRLQVAGGAGREGQLDAIAPSAFAPWLAYEDLFPPDLPPASDPDMAAVFSPILPTDEEAAPSSLPAAVAGLAASEPEAPAAPNYLDVEAVTRGYVRHPLEVVVAWLDRGLAWLEARATRLWRGVSRLWSRNR